MRWIYPYITMIALYCQGASNTVFPDGAQCCEARKRDSFVYKAMHPQTGHNHYAVPQLPPCESQPRKGYMHPRTKKQRSPHGFNLSPIFFDDDFASTKINLPKSEILQAYCRNFASAEGFDQYCAQRYLQLSSQIITELDAAKLTFATFQASSLPTWMSPYQEKLITWDTYTTHHNLPESLLPLNNWCTFLKCSIVQHCSLQTAPDAITQVLLSHLERTNNIDALLTPSKDSPINAYPILMTITLLNDVGKGQIRILHRQSGDIPIFDRVLLMAKEKTTALPFCLQAQQSLYQSCFADGIWHRGLKPLSTELIMERVMDQPSDSVLSFLAQKGIKKMRKKISTSPIHQRTQRAHLLKNLAEESLITLYLCHEYTPILHTKPSLLPMASGYYIACAKAITRTDDDMQTEQEAQRSGAQMLSKGIAQAVHSINIPISTHGHLSQYFQRKQRIFPELFQGISLPEKSAVPALAVPFHGFCCIPIEINSNSTNIAPLMTPADRVYHLVFVPNDHTLRGLTELQKKVFRASLHHLRGEYAQNLMPDQLLMLYLHKVAQDLLSANQ